MPAVLTEERVHRPLIDLHDVLLDCVQTMNEDLRPHGIAIEARISDSVPGVDADPRVIETLLYAVLGNRAKAIETGGKLSVSLGISGDRICIRVADTGWGIPTEAVCGMLGRQDGLRSQPAISISRFHQILESQSGDLSVDRRPGDGSVVTLSFPAFAR